MVSAIMIFTRLFAALLRLGSKMALLPAIQHYILCEPEEKTAAETMSLGRLWQRSVKFSILRPSKDLQVEKIGVTVAGKDETGDEEDMMKSMLVLFNDPSHRELVPQVQTIKAAFF